VLEAASWFAVTVAKNSCCCQTAPTTPPQKYAPRIQQSIAEISIDHLGQPFSGLLFLNSFSAAHLICAPLH
jgi:hypothetical protein